MPGNADCCNLSHDGEQHMRIDADKLGGTVQENPQVAPMDVHEGVKTIAKIVKWLLTSFHVRLKNLIIAYDPSLDAEGKKSSSHRSLVLQISEVEYGTCISEDDSIPDLKLDCLLGAGKLTNFIKFQGVVVEFLQMDNIDNQSQVHGDLSTSFSEWYAGSSPSCCTVTILTGPGGGFSGKMNVSIPWKNGSVDFCKVDADISVNPMEVSIQKDTIMWIIAVWESLRNVNTARESHIPRKAEESSALNSEFRGQFDSLGSSVLLSNKTTPGRGSFSKNSCSTSTQDTDPEGLLPCANVIQNWVPLSLPQEMQVGLESDYGASIDQFFECFDEFRSSQATLGNSGIWNWTCSVFSAITVASNLASGSTHIPTDQRHVETNIQASLGEISVILSFLPEEQEHSQRFLCSLNHMNDPYGMNHSSLLNSNMVEQPSNVPSAAFIYELCFKSMNADQSSIVEIDGANPDVHHLDARFQHVTLNLQIHHQKMNLEASVMYARVDMFYDNGSISRNLEVFNHKSSSCSHMPLSESLQIQVQGETYYFPHARIVLCFPTVKHGDSTQSTSLSKFIVFEFSPFPDLGKLPDASAVRKASSSKGDFCAPSTSIHAKIGSIDGYLVTSQFENTLDEEKCSLDQLLFSAKKVFSMTTGTNDHHYGISMLWQKGPVTGPWMASRTWSMATSHDQRSRNNVTGEGYEFSSVKTAEDLGETNSHIRQELVLSSAFLLGVHLSQVWINLGKHDYELLNQLLSNLIDGLPDKTHGIDINESFENSPNDSSPTQVSILVECDLLDLCINLILLRQVARVKSNRCDYSIDYLRKAGFVKVAHEALVGAILRIKGVTWEIECQEAHINLDSCSDTTDGLSRLVSQLQQLYAPDLEDALVHLQSSSEDVRSVGLLDEIHENAFYMNLEDGSALDHYDSHGLNMHFPGDNCGLNSSNGYILNCCLSDCILIKSQLNFLIHFFGKDADRISSQPNEPNDVEKSEISGKKKVNYGKKAIVEEALLPFFQKCDVRPVVVRVDYIPRRVDLAALRGGNYAELLNLVPWKVLEHLLEVFHSEAVILVCLRIWQQEPMRACESISDGLGRTASALVGTPSQRRTQRVRWAGPALVTAIFWQLQLPLMVPPVSALCPKLCTPVLFLFSSGVRNRSLS
ncbi:hypothetical protein J5N97_011837 [Dioscorea zingiberensis]|uniref:Autophagy-related protein 2 n=1 Tax=Dioscorea zingiberensis TaxID=325984 RepID=A0A9D5HPY5_9LILI|nr:hypothetical protein J5N97_011837 [Dioscorea zingiberensis]